MTLFAAALAAGTGRHEGIRVRRMVRKRQDHPDRADHPPLREAWPEGVAHQARAPQLRRRSSRKGLLSPSRSGLQRGRGRVRRTLGRRARAARGARAFARGADRARLALRPAAGGGLQHYAMPKLEIWRKANAKPLLHPEDEHVVAIAADAPLDTRLPRFDLSDYDGIGDFILSYNGFK